MIEETKIMPFFECFTMLQVPADDRGVLQVDPMAGSRRNRPAGGRGRVVPHALQGALLSPHLREGLFRSVGQPPLRVLLELLRLVQPHPE